MPPLVIAHRGASAERPENTLSAYALAVEQQADMIEIDLHRTRDGSIVIAHDEVLPGIAAIGAATLAQVREVDLGGGERVPTLDEVLDRFGERVPFNLEIKRPVAEPYPELEEAALEAVRSRGLLARTLFSSFSDTVLSRLRALEPEVRLGCLLSPGRRGDPLARARAVGAEALHPWFGLATPPLVAAAHGAGLSVLVYTVDDEAEMRRMLERGVDGIFTNRPARLRELVGAAAPPAGRGRAESR